MKTENRLFFLDNLRAFLIFLVVVLHSALVYETSGMPAAWWIVDDQNTSIWADLAGLWLDVFVMSAVFFISGFFVPAGLEKKGTAGFIKGKVKRLLLPWFIAVFTLIPLYKVIFLFSRGLPQDNWTTYFHFSNGTWGMNWLWFLPVLFIFNLLYPVFSRDKAGISFPKSAVILIVLSTAFSFIMSYCRLQGWMKTPFFDFQNERILIYFLYFVFGAHAHKTRLFEKPQPGNAAVWGTAAVSIILMTMYMTFNIYRLLNPTLYIVNNTVDTLLWAFSYNVTLGVVIAALIMIFKKYGYFKNRFFRTLSQNTYGIYIIHTIVLGICAYILTKINLSADLKLPFLVFSAYFLSSVLVSIYKKGKGLIRNRLTANRKCISIMFFSILFAAVAAGCASLSSCSPGAEELSKTEFAPKQGGEWEVSTPEKQGLDPLLVAGAYYKASKMNTIRSLIVIKDGYLIGEAYFNGSSENDPVDVASVTKSFTSAYVGLAIQEGCIESTGQKMMDFFPDQKNRIRDRRKMQITVEQLLQMRAGYPWEESTSELFRLLYHGFGNSTLCDIYLSGSPGTKFDYSNLSAHILGIIVARSSGTDLQSFAKEHLLNKLNIDISFWRKDWSGNYSGLADTHIRARDMAKFGQLYLDDGMYNGEQILSKEWVEKSLASYTDNAWYYRVGRNFNDVGYGYLWWSVRAGSHRYNLAWGHGGQQIAVVKDLNMVIVVTANSLYGQHGDKPWKIEKSHLNLVADFIAALPEKGQE